MRDSLNNNEGFTQLWEDYYVWSCLL